MLSISAICAARSAPIESPLDSWKAGVPADAAVATAAGTLAAAPAGEGVAGIAFVVEADDDGAGARGGAGVEAVAGAGVEGAFGADAAGAALG